MKLWLMRHPKVLGLLFVILSAWALQEAADGAKTQKRFAQAKPVAADVVAVTRHSGFPPRWRADLAPRDRGAPRSASVIIGTGKGWSTPALSAGETVEILIAADGRDPAILASRRKSDMLRVARVEFEATEFWFGVLFAAGALLCFVFAGRLRREAEALSS